MSDNVRIAEIHTSDRVAFKRCRRRWNWTSTLRQGRETIQLPIPLWFGSGFHYALEDFHGYNIYGDPCKALLAYVLAFRKTPRCQLPEAWEETTRLGLAMFEYYKTWIQYFGAMETYYVNGKPQVEVDFKLDLPEEVQAMARKAGYDRAVYAGHFDRVVIDEYDRLWVQDYKTAKMIKCDHFEGDTQVSAYSWAARKIYNQTVGGAIWQQFLKDVPRPALSLQDGSLSTNKQQRVTYITYRETLKEMYGDVNKAPQKNIQFLNHLAEVQSDGGDRVIHRDSINRNETFLINHEKQIIQEAIDMLNPDTPLYPNQQFTCSWDCPFQVACVSMDDGSDWEFEIENNTQPRYREDSRWRDRLPTLEEVEEYRGKFV